MFFGAVAVDVSEEPVDPEGLQVLLIEEKVSGLFFLLGVHQSLPLNIVLIFVLQSQDGHLVVLAASCASVVSLDLFVLVYQIVFIVVIINEACILEFLGKGLNLFDLEDGVVADVEPWFFFDFHAKQEVKHEWIFFVGLVQPALFEFVDEFSLVVVSNAGVDDREVMGHFGNEGSLTFLHEILGGVGVEVEGLEIVEEGVVPDDFEPGLRSALADYFCFGLHLETI